MLSSSVLYCLMLASNLIDLGFGCHKVDGAQAL